MNDEEVIQLVLDHLRADGLDDIFKPPFLNEPLEARALLESARFQDSMRRVAKAFLRSPSVDGLRPLIRMKIPKTRHAYRQASLVDINDLIKYTALVVKIAPIIEQNRIPEDLNVVFSSRFSSVPPFFGNRHGYDNFRAESHRLSNSGEYAAKVITDISTFYDRLNIHRLEGALVDIGCNASCVSAIDQILKQWAGRNSYGIPVGCDASRLLAEAMLISIDNALVENSIVFVRYVDDYRIFARTYAEAHSHLNVLINALDREGLFINSEKTRIIGCEEIDKKEQSGDEEPVAEFDRIDEAEKVPVQVKTQTRYSTKISLYYKTPGKEKIREIQKSNADEILKNIMSSDVDEVALRDFVKIFIYGVSHSPETLMTFLRRHIHMLQYTVSALIKEFNRIDKGVRGQLSLDFEKLYEQLSETEYYRICISRLLSNDNYYREGVFGRWFGRLRPDANPLFIRELICFFQKRLSRSELRQLIEYSGNAPLCVHRAIVQAALISNSTKGQKMAWCRSWVNSSNDPYILDTCRDYMYPPLAGANPPADGVT